MHKPTINMRKGTSNQAIISLQVVSITKTSPCNEDPLTPSFYIVKLGFTGVIIFILIFALTLIVGTH